ncbi:HD-GYP domain-containing protein [Solemya pervernicosa gill symbiont]|uniref:HD-GYP domain-containing protein n=1 Tax=Solemya pervernicosa gill symbiont TaxID=642797 RepID=UPI001F22BD17|nr:HD domain-containing phosphohydrolase [Solemya pervernicosa gill symbiont]
MPKTNSRKNSDSPAIYASGKGRVVHDLSIFAKGEGVHTRKIDSKGYGSSYTLPMYHEGEFRGFIFFNASDKHIFDDETLHYLELFAHVLTLLISSELESMRTLAAAVRTVCDITQHRDNETGTHLDRMSRYSRIIAQELAPKHNLDDEFIEQLFLFSPLHDIGKIAIPDEILLKPGKLDANEWQVMKTHASKGREMIQTLLDNFGLDAVYRIEMLHNISEYHHEKMNGGGYPHGLKGDQIPLESRIVAVADIFDALTSDRPYKEAWDNDRAFALLRKLAGDELDRECVDALLNNRERIEKVQQKFSEHT